MAEQTPINAPKSPSEVFWTFFWIAMQSFGGPMALIQRCLIEDKKWYTRDEYIEMLTLVQAIPGPNVSKVVIMAGERFFGLRGAILALAGFTVVPALCVIGLCLVIEPFLHSVLAQSALKGMLVGAAGIIFGSALSLCSSMKTHPLGPALWLLGGSIAFSLMAFFHFSLASVLLLVGIPWVFLTYWQMKRKGLF